MTGTIYCLENHLTDKMYIGQTTDFNDRMRKYATGHCHKGALRNAILKYGWKHFSVKVVEEIPVEDLDEAERFWIAFLDTKAPKGYNLTDGGDGSTGFKHTSETRELLREIALKRVDEGTHHFQVDNPATAVHREKLNDGTHNFLVNHPNERRLNDGTHNFLVNHPMKDSAIVAKRNRTKRKNRGWLDWVDMLEEDS